MWGREVDSDSKATKQKRKKIKPRRHEVSRVNNEAHSHNAAFSRKGSMLTEVEKEFCRVQGGGLDGRAAGSEIVQVRVDDIGEVG